MKSPPIDFVGRLQKGHQKAVVLTQTLDHRAHFVAILHGQMMHCAWLRRSKLRTCGRIVWPPVRSPSLPRGWHVPCVHVYGSARAPTAQALNILGCRLLCARLARQSTGAAPMRTISRATATNPNIRVVFVDLLEQQMIDLNALRKRVTEAERRVAAHAHKPLNLQLTREAALLSAPSMGSSSAPLPAPSD